MQVVEMGSIEETHGDSSLPKVGLVVESSVDELRRAKIPLYTDVVILPKKDLSAVVNALTELEIALKAAKTGCTLIEDEGGSSHYGLPVRAVESVQSAFSKLNELKSTTEVWNEL